MGSINDPLFLSMDTIECVKGLIQEYLEQNGIEIVEIINRREQGSLVLRLLIDKPEGVVIKDCEKVNKYLSKVLDEENVFEGHYLIEVCSPGLDRPIRSDRDFERSLNKDITVTTYVPVDGTKTHEGSLVGLSKDEVVLESNGISTVIPRSKIAMARLKIDF